MIDRVAANRLSRVVPPRCPKFLAPRTHLGAQHQVLNDEICVALEPRAGRRRSREDPILDSHARRHRATAAPRRLGGFGSLASSIPLGLSADRPFIPPRP